jgi:tripeptidyl-peptidase-1
MLALSNLLVVAVVAQAVFANPIKVRTDYAVKEVHQAPRRWASAGRAPSNHMLHLQIGLKQERFDELEQQLLEGMFTDPAGFMSLISK